MAKGLIALLVLGCSLMMDCGETNKGTDSALENLRKIMKREGITAYIVPSTDSHQSEYCTSRFRRLEFLTGFTGSTATAVVTSKSAVMWTDTRYLIQAAQQVSSSWKIICSSDKENPTVITWINEELKEAEKVGVDPQLITYNDWNSYTATLNDTKKELISVKKNLIDEIWVNYPPIPSEPIFIHEEKYSGESFTKKLHRLRESVRKAKADAVVLTNLDDVAWLFNLRGSDVPFTPIFYSYATITNDEVTLYILPNKIKNEVHKYLTEGETKVKIKHYEEICNDLTDLGQKLDKLIIPASNNYTRGASSMIYSTIPCKKVVSIPSPVINLRAYKNEIEANGSRRAHVRDAVALCEMMQLLETEIPQNVDWDELKVSSKLEQFRAKQELNRGLSFDNIVAFGKNGALPHYIPSNETNLKIDTSAPLTIDSGGQYLDGTIDTTRVLHFGEPTKEEKEVYTVLLRGVIDLGSTVFPQGTTMQEMEFVIRRPLYQFGYNYGHGSTHGTGVFLGVHETFNYTYGINFIGSQEPGYYKEDHFGMRLENLVIVVPAKIENHTKKVLLTFEPLTLVPYESKLIDIKMLDNSHIVWINNYHERVFKEVGDEMLHQGKMTLHTWLKEKTKPLETIKR